MQRIVYYARLIWEVAQSFTADKCTFLAAGLCYFVFFSIFPLLLLLISVAGYFLTVEQAMVHVAHLLQQLFPQQADLLLDILRGVMEHRDKASLFGVATLLWASKNIFQTLGQALNIIWKVPRDRGLIKENLLALGLSISVGVLIFLSSLCYAVLYAIVNFRFPMLGLSPSQIPGIVFLIANILPLTLVTLLLMGLYMVLPNRRLSVQQVFLGALVAALLWEVLRRVFGYFMENMSRFDAVYGSISGIVGFLLWIFLSANIFLLGAEIAWVLNEHQTRLRGRQARLPAKKSLSDRRA